MSELIPFLTEADLPADLAAVLRPRVARLGYLGEFFRCAAHQPKALMSFMEFTKNLKEALPDNLTEVVALSVARLMDNSYERVQHERLSLKLGFGEKWLREVLALRGEGNDILSPQEALVQRLVIAVVNRKGKDCASELEGVARAVGPAMTVAVLMLIGRYMTHALIVNTINLAPPVASPLENK
jgi:alkylhydroperoxidase family enzyme